MRSSALKKLSLSLLADTVAFRRRAKRITQKQLSDLTGINRSLLSRLESGDFVPSVEQLQSLGEVLGLRSRICSPSPVRPRRRRIPPWRSP